MPKVDQTCIASSPTDLAILVESDRHAAYCLPLAQAAAQQGKQVCIHFTHQGVQLLERVQLPHLRRWARVTICLESYRNLHDSDTTAAAEILADETAAILVAPGYEVDLIKNSHRVIIF
ncbi:MAG: hypothetical protein QNJ22_05520 [Desulfosarcinaceae bacterium]|nr:hypothetical protein [Desulfosarcinaceae bacterium]